MEIMKKDLKKQFMKIFGTISPILITPTTTSVTISLSTRFILFTLMKKIINVIEEDPYLNFISLLKSYKVLGRFLHGTLHEFYRDRKKLYFKNFFHDRKLYEEVVKDIEFLYPEHRDLKMTMTKRGVIVYDNYKPNAFNALLVTIHSGCWIPETLRKKMEVSPNIIINEEDTDTHRLYCRLVLDKAGIWIDNKQSRFVCDFNRSLSKAIYTDRSEAWLDIVWKEQPTKKERDEILQSYEEFYFTLERLAESYHFNIIWDGHSMRDAPDRANISFGTQYIPRFYMPIVISMRKKLIALGYKDVALNKPYTGGYILRWFNNRFPHLFICSMEINKLLYMDKQQGKVNAKHVEKLSKDMAEIFNIEETFDDIATTDQERAKETGA